MILDEVNARCKYSVRVVDRTSVISIVDFKFRVSNVGGTSAVANEPCVKLGSS
jgi:hypothetical protein